jgi:prepilin-type N-terminal cleavage/methylation domain-containing protein
MYLGYALMVAMKTMTGRVSCSGKRIWELQKMISRKSQAAFTLVELLVVISIISLLMGILLPALNKARYTAKMMVCTSNSKQIGNLIASYQADNEGRVPVMLNRFTPMGSSPLFPAKSRLLSVALYRYSSETKNLSRIDKGIYSPDKDWGNSQDTRTKPTYFKQYLPKIYVCPFLSGKNAEPGKDFREGSPVSLNGTPFRTMIRTGIGESYVTWCWELERDYPYTVNHPLGLPNGTPKYGALSWNAYSQLQTLDYGQLDHAPVMWDKASLRRIKSNSMSEATITYCEQGETDNYAGGPNLDNGIYNYGSHKKSGRGGTNALFADMHAEWVEGTRIGWP